MYFVDLEWFLLFRVVLVGLFFYVIRSGWLGWGRVDSLVEGRGYSRCRRIVLVFFDVIVFFCFFFSFICSFRVGFLFIKGWFILKITLLFGVRNDYCFKLVFCNLVDKNC